MNDDFLKVLYEIKKSFGLEVFENSRRINSILLDLAPDMKKERIQIINLINAGGYRAFSEHFVSYELVYYKLLDIMENEYGVQLERAHWAIGIFSKVFYGEHFYTGLDLHISSISKKFDRNIDSHKIAAGSSHTVVRKDNGKAAAVGDNRFGQCNVDDWENIKAVFAKGDVTVGITNKKEILAVGNISKAVKTFKNVEKVYIDELVYGIDTAGNILVPDEWKQSQTIYDFSKFNDLKGLAIGAYHILGLKSSGKVVAAGSNEKGQMDVYSWRNIISVAAGYWFSVGLVQDGTVVACGSNLRGQCEISTWDNILAIYTTGDRTVGLRKDGTVLATGNNEFGQCNVEKWRNIVSISLSDDHTVGLSDEGIVYAAGRNDCYQCNTEHFRKVVAVTAGDSHTIGLLEDGTLVDVGANESGQCNIEGIHI